MKPWRTTLRRPLTLMLAGTLAATLAACSSGSSGGSGGKHTLVVWDAHGPLFKTAIAPVISAYEKANPNTKVQIQPVDWATFQQRVLASAAGGQLPCVMYSNSQVEAAIAAANVMEPVNSKYITSAQMSQYLPAFKQDLQDTNGQQLFVPFLGGANQFYVRTNGAASAPTPPRTYSEWVNWAKANSSYSGGNLTKPGLGWRYDVPANAWPTSEFMTLVLAAGGQFLDGNNGPTAKKALFDSPAGQTALQFWHDTIWKDHVALPPNKVSEPQDNAISNFVSGKEASSYVGPWLPNAVASLQGAAAAFKSTWDATYLAPEPDNGGKNVTVISTDGWGVPKACKYSDDAWKFIQFMTSKQSMITFFKVFQHPVARTDAMLSPEVAQVIAANMAGAKHELDLWKDPSVTSAAVAEPNTRYNADLFNVVSNDLESYLNDPNGNTVATLQKLSNDVNHVLTNG